MSLLDELKRQARAKQSEQQQAKQRQAELEARTREEVLPKLAQIYSYLNEFLKQIAILQPDVRADYNLKGYGMLTGLRQEGYELHADSRENMTRLLLGFNCTGEGEVKFELDTQQQVEQQKDFFKQYDLAYKSREYRDERHVVTRAQFSFEPRIPVSFNFQLATDLSQIILTIHNHDGLGTHRYQFEPGRIDEDFLDEMAKYILRWENKFLKLDISENFLENLRQRLANEDSAKAAPEVEKRSDSNVTYLDVKRKEKQASRNKSRDELVQDIVVPAVPAEDSKVEGTESEQTEHAIPPALNAQTEHYTRFANLPSPIKELKRSELEKAPYVERLEQLRNFPDRLFQSAAQIMSGFNRALIKPNKRLELVSAVIGQVYPVLAEAIEKYRTQRHSLPENHTRRETLIAATMMVEQCAIAYKHVLKTDILESSEKNHERMSMCAFRIMELFRIEQRLRALRYQKLPVTAWEDCNKVFFYVHEHLDANKEFKLLGTASRWVKDKARLSYSPPSCNIKKLFFSIQLVGVLDVTTWPVWLFHVADLYLDFVENAVRLIPDQGQDVAQGWLITSVNHNGPASFKRLESMQAPMIMIDYSNMYNYMVTEHELLTKRRATGDQDDAKLSDPLQEIDKYDRIPVLETILLKLRARERHQKRHTAIDSEILRVYFGFEEAYRLLSDLAHLDKAELAAMRDFVDNLAGKSSLVLDEEQTTIHGWQMINFSAGGLLLGTEESDFTSPIEVGQIVAFTPVEHSNNPLLGCVMRVQRNSYRHVDIAIFRLSTHAEAALAILAGKDRKKGLPGILLRAMDNKWKILLPNQYNLTTGEPIELMRANGERVPARLGGLWYVKNKFTIYEISSPKLS